MPTQISHVHRVILPQLVRVVDGDTWRAYIDLDFRHIGFQEFRLYGWDTPEKQGPLTSPAERAKAAEATALARQWWVDVADLDIFVETQKDPEKYGRWLATLWAERGPYRSDLGTMLGSADLAVPSDGTRGTRWRDTH